jgi:hypothetical protein
MTSLELLQQLYPGAILLTLDQTAIACGAAPGTIRTAMCRRGSWHVRHRKMGGSVRFHISDVAKFLDRGCPKGKGGRPRKTWGNVGSEALKTV